MREEVGIRAYEPRDRSAIRELCCDTAQWGAPMRTLFPDGEVLADLLTRYYTDYEPHSVWVAESAGSVIGYLTGCLDSRRARWITAWLVGPWVVWRALARGALCRWGTWRLLGAGVGTWWRGGLRRRASVKPYPAHLHVNVRQGFRGRQVGQRLVERFLEQARQAGVAGVHASVRGDNVAGRHFFERLGFAPLGRSPVALPAGTQLEFHETIIYGKRV